jgi:sugar lactone lactonase YvrE
MDGMRCDIKGNLYITRFGKGMVVIASPEGKVIREISLVGKRPTNIAIGGKTDVQFMLLSRIRGTLRVSV